MPTSATSPSPFQWSLPPIEPNAPIDSLCLTLRWPDDAPVDPTFAEILSDVASTVNGLQTRETILEGLVGDEQPVGFRFYVEPAQATEAIEAIRHQFESLAEDFNVPQPNTISISPILRDDWENAWKEHWHATRISDRLTICPTWEANEYQAEPNEQVIVLDPGRAFGTGSHGTTRMALQALDTWAQSNNCANSSILDLGCGSGVLAIAAAKLGAKDIVALDILDDAVTATDTNAAANSVGHCISASTTPLDERCMFAFDLILANIQAQVIVTLLPAMLERLADNGVILATGIIPQYESLMTDAFEAAGLTVTRRLTDTNGTQSEPSSTQWILLQAEKL